jgi:hypothetical protein
VKEEEKVVSVGATRVNEGVVKVLDDGVFEIDGRVMVVLLEGLDFLWCFLGTKSRFTFFPIFSFPFLLFASIKLNKSKLAITTSINSLILI